MVSFGLLHAISPRKSSICYRELNRVALAVFAFAFIIENATPFTNSHRLSKCKYPNNLTILSSKHVPKKLSCKNSSRRQAERSTLESIKMYSLAQNDLEESDDARSSRLQGILVLLTVPLSWGTFAPCVRYIYALDPPVPGFVFSAGYYGVAATALIALNMIMGKKMKKEDQQLGEMLESSSSMEIAKEGEKGFPVSAIAGLELGGYLFLGNALQVVGLQTVPADRAAFLVQLTTIIVPVLAATFAKDIRSISAKTWVACLIAFAGVITMELDGQEEKILDKLGEQTVLTASTSDPTSAITWIQSHLPSADFGDSLIVLASISYSFHVLRLSNYANRIQPLSLAASKATVEFSLSTLTVIALLGMGSASNPFSKETVDFFTVWGSKFETSSLTWSQVSPALGAILWTGLITCAYTIYAQSYGQRTVKPTDANLIYGCQPIFSSIFAYFLLGEQLGWIGFVGGALIATAILLVSYDPSDKKPKA